MIDLKRTDALVRKHVQIVQTTHLTFKNVITLGQLFGLFPVHGHDSTNFRQVTFRWISWKTFYSIVLLTGSVFSLVMCVFKFCKLGFVEQESGSLIFYFGTTLGIYNLISIAKNWKHIIREWTDVETALYKYGISRFKTRFLIHSCVFLILGLLEHVLFICNNLQKFHDAYPDPTYRNSLGYFNTTFVHVFTLIECNLATAVLVEFINVMTTFAWNFADLFIMLVSSALALNFRTLKNKLSLQASKYLYWHEIRTDYNRINKLNVLINQHISGLVGVSIAVNMLFICVQLYNTLKPRSSIIHSIYFFYSFGFLLARTIAIVIYAAWVNDECKEILYYLHTVPSNYHNIEVYRLTLQIVQQPAGITVANVFLVTRSILLKISGTIVTIELMFFQFNVTRMESIMLTSNSTVDLN